MGNINKTLNMLALIKFIPKSTEAKRGRPMERLVIFVLVINLVLAFVLPAGIVSAKGTEVIK